MWLSGKLHSKADLRQASIEYVISSQWFFYNGVRFGTVGDVTMFCLRKGKKDNITTRRK